MAVDKPVKVPERRITSTDVLSFSSGLDQRSPQNTAKNTFNSSRNMMVTSQGLLTHRYVQKRWLPDTVETCYEIFPALYDGELYYLVADDGEVKYCQEGDASWTSCGGTNAVTTGDGVINTFLRVSNKVLVLNGTDTLRYIDLTNLEMVQFTSVTDPSNAPTATLTGLTGSNHKIYYAISFNSTVGETDISPILSQNISKQRSSWAGGTTEYITIDRNNSAPSGAVSWNLWMSIAPAGAAIDTTDMLLLAGGIDLNSTTYVDDGTGSVNLDYGPATGDNSTDGPIAKYGIETNGRPILYGNPTTGKQHDVYIGGDGEEHALDFSPGNGGFKAVLNSGTNYYPMSVVGFRNGQGIPSLTVLFSNTQGLSKQSILEQQTVTYGSQSFVVWAVTEQNYGAAGISSPYAVVNYLGGLHFPSYDGFMTADTEQSLQNVLATKRVSDPVEELVGAIRKESMSNIVGTAWGNRIYWLVPKRGYDYNNTILVRDLTNKDSPYWYTLDIRAQWVGTVSPDDKAAFVYVCRDNHIFRLVPGYIAMDDTSEGTSEAFPLEATGTFLGFDDGHTSYKAIVQAVFYLLDVIGTVTVGVTYRNENGRIKTKTKTITRAAYAPTSNGGWSSPGYVFGLESTYIGWDDLIPIDDTNSSAKEDVRVRLPLNVLASEVQWSVSSDLTNTTFTLRSVSYEGQDLGTKVDLK